MAKYQINWKKSAAKELKSLPSPTISKILSTVQGLSNNPYPPKTRKLTGTQHHYRIRVGDYRVIYSIESSILVIEIIRVGHRKDVYRG